MRLAHHANAHLPLSLSHHASQRRLDSGAPEQMGHRHCQSFYDARILLNVELLQPVALKDALHLHLLYSFARLFHLFASIAHALLGNLVALIFPASYTAASISAPASFTAAFGACAVCRAIFTFFIACLKMRRRSFLAISRFQGH